MRTCNAVVKSLCLLGSLLMVAPPMLAEEWISAPELNFPRSFFGAAVDECGNIWAVGGWNRTGGCDDASGPVYDTIEKLEFDGESYADEWVVVPTVMPTPRVYHNVAAVNGHIYVIGGLDGLLHEGGNPVLRVDRYDTVTGSLDSTATPELRAARQDHGCTVDRMGRIWVVGGAGLSDGSWNTLQTVEIFDPARPEPGEWQDGPPLLNARQRCGCVTGPDGRIYVIGGYDMEGDHISTIEWLDPCRSDTWQLHPAVLPPPTTIDDQAVFGADGYIYVAGGWRSHTWEDRVVRLDPAADCFEQWLQLPQARDLHRMVLGDDGYIYAVGGESFGCLSIPDVTGLYTGQCLGDLDYDRDVDLADLAILLARYGETCP